MVKLAVLIKIFLLVVILQTIDCAVKSGTKKHQKKGNKHTTPLGHHKKNKAHHKTTTDEIIKDQGHENKAQVKHSRKHNEKNKHHEDVTRMVDIKEIKTAKPKNFTGLDIDPSADHIEKEIRVPKEKTVEDNNEPGRHHIEVNPVDEIGTDIKPDLNKKKHKSVKLEKDALDVKPIDDLGASIKRKVMEKKIKKGHIILKHLEVTRMVDIGKEIKHAKKVDFSKLDIEPDHKGQFDAIVSGHNKSQDQGNPLDLSDYMRWLIKEKDVSRLERFRQLEHEIVMLEKQQDHNQNAHDYKKKTTKPNDKTDEKLSIKVAAIIEQLEAEEGRNLKLEL